MTAAHELRTTDERRSIVVRPRCQGTRDRGEKIGRPCAKVLAEMVTPPWAIKCSRCGFVNTG